MIKKILCLMAALVMITVIGAGTCLAASKTSSELTALEDKLSAATKKRKDAEASVSAAEASYTDALAKKQVIDNKIYALDVEIDALIALINGYNAQIEAKNTEISNQTVRLDEQHEKVRQRIRIRREEGEVNFLSVMFESDGLTELFLGMDRFMSMLKYDKRLLEGYNNGLSELNKMKDELTASKAQLDTQMKELAIRRSELEADLKAASLLVASTENKLSTAERDLERVAAAEAEFNKKREELLASLKNTSNESYVGGVFLWPLPQSYTRVSSGYGQRTHPVTGKPQFHIGIDIPAPYGTEIYATNDGTVIECGYNYADGYYVTINHGGGVASFYSHVSKRHVAVGDKVKRGQVIANVGTSGYTTGPHLNLNIYENGSAVNPMKYFQ